MAEDQATHVMYRGRHYIIPGKHGPEEALKRVQNLAGAGPKLRSGSSTREGFEDTSADARAVLEKYHEPNRARDVLPKLAEFALLYGSIPSVVGLPGRAAGALSGLSVGGKAAVVGKAALKAGAYAGAGVAANEGLQAAGVPRGVSEAVVGAAGLATKPGRAMLRAGVEALAGEAAVAPAAARAAAVAAPVAAEAVAVKAEAEQIAAQLLKWKEAGMSGAQMTASLRQVYGVPMKDATALVKALQAGPAAAGEAAAATAAVEAPAASRAAGPLQPERIRVGAQRVGRDVGMTKEQVRVAAGPVLGETLGDASPILPKKALQSIIDTMKTLPKTGGAREAYVARATSGKSQWQIENVRRTLEHLGLLAPVAVAAGAAAQE